jgi:hypothetical protein
LSRVLIEEKKMAENNQNSNSVLPQNYGCEILLEKTTLEKTKDSSFPNNAYLIWYIENGNEYLDLTRTRKMSDLFDMYYDKYGPGSVKKIIWGYGRVNPKLWGYTKPEKRGKRGR